MAIEIVKMFTEFKSEVLNGRADVDFKVITFTFGADFFPPFCSIKQDFLSILSFSKYKQESKATSTGKLSEKWEQTSFNLIKAQYMWEVFKCAQVSAPLLGSLL